MGMTGMIPDSFVWNGTFGYAFMNGIEVMLLKSIKTSDTIEYTEIAQPRRLRDGRKMIKVGGTGEIVALVHTKVLVREMAKMIDQGLQPEVTIEATNDDPASPDALYMGFQGCTIENLDYVNADAHTEVEETFTFSFSDRTFLN